MDALTDSPKSPDPPLSTVDFRPWTGSSLTRRRFLAQTAALGVSAAALALLGPPEVLAVPTGRGPLPIEQYIRIRGAGGASFSSDGRQLAYLSNESGLIQVWTMDVETGVARQRTFGSERVTFVVYAPRAAAVLFGSDVGGNERFQFSWLDLESGRALALTNQPNATHAFGGWAPDGRRIAFASNRRRASVLDVYVQEVPEGEARLVLEGEVSQVPMGWSPDGQALILSRAQVGGNDLYLLDLASSELRYLTPHDGEARYFNVGWAADGRHLQLITDQGRDRAALVELDPADGSNRPLVQSEWEVEGFTRRAQWLAWRANESGYSVLHVLDLQANAEVPLPALPAGVISVMRWVPGRGRRLAFTLSGFDQSADIWLVDLDDQTGRPLTSSSRGEVPPDSFVSPRLARYLAADGLEIPAFLYLPPEGPLEVRPPALFFVHGGPVDQERPSFNSIFQYFVQRGYAVFAPNVRGSAGYGRRYAHLDDGRHRMDAVADLESGWRWLVDGGLVDPDRVAIMGTSYGGFMVLAALVTHPELWAAGVDIAGITDLSTLRERTAPSLRGFFDAEFGVADEDPDFLRSISPLYQAERIRAPLLVIHGANDPRVPINQAEQLVARLRGRGAAVQYLRFDNEGHGLARLENQLVAYQAIADFLDRTLDVNP